MKAQTETKWSVYAHKGGFPPKMQPLGYVRAVHQPDALLKAFKRWPDERNENKVQAGFVVRLWSADYFPLGKYADNPRDLKP